MTNDREEILNYKPGLKNSLKKSNYFIWGIPKVLRKIGN